jgi:hypothetical protein
MHGRTPCAAVAAPKQCVNPAAAAAATGRQLTTVPQHTDSCSCSPQLLNSPAPFWNVAATFPCLTAATLTGLWGKSRGRQGSMSHALSTKCTGWASIPAHQALLQCGWRCAAPADTHRSGCRRSRSCASLRQKANRRSVNSMAICALVRQTKRSLTSCVRLRGEEGQEEAEREGVANGHLCCVVVCEAGKRAACCHRFGADLL